MAICFTGAAALHLAACSDSPTASKEEPGLRLLSPQVVTDSAGAISPIEVEVRDAQGRVQSDVEVRFTGRAASAAEASAAVSGAASFVSRTNSRGRATATVQLGSRAGTTAVQVSVPAAGYQDSVRYTVTPGAATRVHVEPVDSALFVGASYSLRGKSVDRHGNPRSDPLSYSVVGTHASLSQTALRGESIGRAFVLARHGSLVDTAWVSVVPRGVLAAYEFPFYYNGNGPDIRQPGRIVTLNTDGSDYRVLLEQRPAVIPFSYAEGMQPSWSPSGDEIAYINASRLMRVDLAGVAREVYLGTDAVHAEFAPQYSPDGQWIYFTRGRDGHQRTFWRVRPDGTGAQQVSPAENWGIEVMPSPDPTGQSVAFQTNRRTNSTVDFTIRTLNVQTRAVTSLDIPGAAPRWSPTGEWIALINGGRLQLVRPSGGQIHSMGSGVGAHPTYAWSPDGTWIIISGNQPNAQTPGKVGLQLVNVATGEVLPLGFDRTLVQPSWRR
ncbi:MAG TPA: hypothetical protein VGB66_06300 [Longimicrobium sp.]